MNTIEDDQCLITLCPIDENPTMENIIKLKCRGTEELLVSLSSLSDNSVTYKNAINISLYDDYVYYKNTFYKIIHMLTVSNERFLKEYQHKYTHTYSTGQS